MMLNKVQVWFRWHRIYLEASIQGAVDHNKSKNIEHNTASSITDDDVHLLRSVFLHSGAICDTTKNARLASTRLCT